MRRWWPVCVGFLVCLAAVVTAMGWVSLSAARLDRAEAAARRQAALEERVRLALWRADSTLAPLIAQESVRPWFVYHPFLRDPAAGGGMLPSPLLTAAAPHVLVHFQFEPDGQLTSPEVPGNKIALLAPPPGVSPETLRKSRERLDEVRSLVDRNRLVELLPRSSPVPVAQVVPPAAGPAAPAAKPSAPLSGLNSAVIDQQDDQWSTAQAISPNNPLSQTKSQRAVVLNRRSGLIQKGDQDAVEFEVRNDLLLSGANTFTGALTKIGGALSSAPIALPGDVNGVPLTPLWFSDRLILARRIVAGGREYLQGCLLDWPEIKTVLLETIHDLLPEADFQPVASGPADEGRRLAALPVRLVPGDWAVAEPGQLSPILLALAVAWTCMGLAAAAVAGLVIGVVRLSERRASFVTAVTHELRTPLTTFQMYTEMLAEGMLPEEADQRRYLGTLRLEALRLTHMVENVLSYARLERGRAEGRCESLVLGELVDRMTGRLAARAEQSGMRLIVEGDDAAQAVIVRVNPSAVEQILLNLVDNACKYASAGDDPRLCLALAADRRGAELSLRDHGPGVPASERRRLFRPFSKSARKAAESAPGVGLGLALSRRLARDMGGDLRLDADAGPGARFVLALPLSYRS